MSTKPVYATKPYPAWDAAKAASLDAVGKLIYRSNLLGSDRALPLKRRYGSH